MFAKVDFSLGLGLELELSMVLGLVLHGFEVMNLICGGYACRPWSMCQTIVYPCQNFSYSHLCFLGPVLSKSHRYSKNASF